MVKSKSLREKINKQGISSEFQTSNIVCIKIQCPDCGKIFILNKDREYYCELCERVFLEDEIRARCGI